MFSDANSMDATKYFIPEYPYNGYISKSITRVTK